MAVSQQDINDAVYKLTVVCRLPDGYKPRGLMIHHGGQAAAWTVCQLSGDGDDGQTVIAAGATKTELYIRLIDLLRVNRERAQYYDTLMGLLGTHPEGPEKSEQVEGLKKLRDDIYKRLISVKM